jgi:hypothetical protein
MTRVIILALVLGATLGAQQLTPDERATLRAAAVLLERLSADPITHVKAGDDLQAALDAAQPGDILELEQDAVFTGNYLLGTKAGTVTVRGLATLRSPSNLPALATRPGALHWRIQGLTFRAHNPAGDIIRFGASPQTLEEVPSQIVLEECRVLGDPMVGQKRGIALNSASTTIRRCEFKDIKRQGQDSQAIAGWNGPGPYVLEANVFDTEATELVLFGGADPSIPGLVPSDIDIIGNTFTRPEGWRHRTWAIKNLLELKAGRNVRIVGNRFSQHGRTAANGDGFFLWAKSVNQDGGCSWCVVEDVLIADNIATDVGAGITLAGDPGAVHRAIPMRNITLRNNRLETDAAGYGGRGTHLMIQGVADVTVERNSFLGPGGATSLYLIPPESPRLAFTGNILIDKCGGDCWGIMGQSSGEGVRAFDRWAPGYTYRENLIVTPTPLLYGPGQNRIEATMPADVTGYGSTP